MSHSTTYSPLAGTLATLVAEPPVNPLRKYLIVTAPGDIRELPIVFAQNIQHSVMVPKGHNVVSAGFVLLVDKHVRIPAVDSDSLHIGPRPQDQKLLTHFLQPF